MVDSVNAIGGAEIYKAGAADTSLDFNKDGKVDTGDYNYALQKVIEADDDKYEGYTKEDLDEAFKDFSVKLDTDSQVTEDNAETLAAQIIKDVTGGVNNPENAKTLNQLQVMGLALTKQIEQSAAISKILDAKIKQQDEELAEIEKEKETKAKEYASKEATVNAKAEELAQLAVKILVTSTQISEERQVKANNTVIRCIQEYKEGKYPNKPLKAVIEEQLGAKGDGFNVYTLSNLIHTSTGLGAEINSLCSEIDDLVGDIKSITEKYNAKNAERNTSNTLLKGITEAATKANQQYQSGYERRDAMRQELIDKYKVAGQTAGDIYTDNNPQVQKLGEFLDNKELDNMPFADAWAVLTKTFDQCGIKYNENTGAIAVPKGHNAGAKNIYSALCEALNKNYKNLVSQYDDEEEGFEDDEQPAAGEVTAIQRTDPITFTNGDIRYDIIKDKNQNGVLDNASEFVGADTGWAEMKAFDKDGDGKISGGELKNVALAATNQTNGQFTFVSAEEAGIESIDLNSFKSVNQKEVNKDITVGTFEVKMTDGQTITGKQTEDTNRNIANTYSTMFGNKIEDRTNAYDDNPFMEEFQETTNTDLVTSTSEESIKSTKVESDTILEIGETEVNQKVRRGAIEGEQEKAAADAKAAKKEKAAKKKEAAKEEAKAEEKKAEEKKAEEKKAANKKTNVKKK